MTTISTSNYPNLYGTGSVAPTSYPYAILAAAGITGTGTIVISDNGRYGATTASGVTITPTGGTLDNTNALNAQNNLTTLVGDLNTIATNIGTTSYSGTATGATSTFYSGTVYRSPIATAIEIGDNATLVFDGSGNLDAQFFIHGRTAITFAGTSNSITLQNGAQSKNIFWWADTGITLNGVLPKGTYIAGTAVTLTGNTLDVSGNLFAQGTLVSIVGPTLITPLCYLKGSKILTENGYKLVEDLKEGDLVVSKGKIINNESYEIEEDSLLKPIKWIGKFNIYNFNTDSFPICIQANALGDNLPLEDLFVSPGHRFLLDGKMICARDLVNGTTIFQDININSIEYYHFELLEHSSVIANGVLTESYLDLDTKSVFDK